MLCIARRSWSATLVASFRIAPPLAHFPTDGATVSVLVTLTQVRVTGRAGASGRRLIDPDHVAGRVADGEVLRAPELLGRFLDDLRAGVADLGEGGVEVVGPEVDAV